MFANIANQKRVPPQTTIKVHLHDVETLNHFAVDGKYDITKLSFHAWLRVCELYQLLDVGAALGFGCGPLLISKKNLARADLKNLRVALPGELTTAHLLFQLWAGEAKNKIFVPYDKIFNSVKNGEADCGVIIHEGRFTYEEAGFQLIVDLGEWWEELTKLPIPLGCIAAKRNLGEQRIEDFSRCLRLSLEDAKANPRMVYPYMKKHAQEMSEAVLMKHVDAYVNRFSLSLGESGHAAVQRLEALARERGIIS